MVIESNYFTRIVAYLSPRKDWIDWFLQIHNILNTYSIFPTLFIYNH